MFAMEKAQNLIALMENNAKDIASQINDTIQQRILKNREVVKSVTKCVLLCGKQNIGFRGHRDDANYLQDGENSGNFQALLEFRLDSGDTILKDHLKFTGKNCTYRSKTIQNEIIDVIKDYITDKLIEEVKAAELYSVSCDEKADCSNKEQLSLCLRFVDAEFNIREVFLTFLNVTGETTGVQLATKIKSTLTGWGLNLADCRGQTYDGAACMSGKTNGAAALITKDYPKAVYVHCVSHCLNLALSKCGKQQLIRNMIDTSEKVVLFYNYSPKRNSNLQKWIDQLCPNSNKNKLLDTCTTRFIQRHDALEVFVEFYAAIEASLGEMSTTEGFNRETSSDATALYAAITQFQYIIVMIVTKNVMGYTKGLSRSLQGRSEDIVRAYSNISLVKATVADARTNVDDKYSQWFQEASALAASVDVLPSIPRRCVQQRNRDNTPGDSPDIYYKRALVIPYLDELISQLDERFSSFAHITVQGINLTPSSLVKNSSESLFTELEDFVQLYKHDLPSPAGLRSELELWYKKWKHSKSVPDTAAKAIKLCNQIDFPNVFQMLKIVCTIGVTSCECERSNSELRLLKTYLRSTMSQERLNGLALMHVHYRMAIDLDEIVNRMARKHPRRLRLAEILND